MPCIYQRVPGDALCPPESPALNHASVDNASSNQTPYALYHRGPADTPVKMLLRHLVSRSDEAI